LIAAVFLISPVLFEARALMADGPAGLEDAPGEAETLEDVLGGFDDESSVPATEEAVEDERAWDVSGHISLGGSYNFSHKAPKAGETDYRGLSRLRLSLGLGLDYRLSEEWKCKISGKGFYDLAYALNGRGKYTGEVLDEHEDEVELGETYVQGPVLDDLDLKAGRQVAVWGKSESIRVTDVLNPLDNREPGLVDIEDLRLPVGMTRLDYYLGRWSLTGIAVHEIRFDKDPPYGSDFYPVETPLPPEETPDETEYALAVNGILSGWDISFYWARLFEDRPHVELDSTRTVLRHSRLTMLGAAMDLARGNWLLKSEAAYFEGLEYYTLPGEEKSRIDVLAGIEYSGFGETTISVEAANRHIAGFEEEMKEEPDSAKEDEFLTALRYRRDFLNQTLHLTLLALTFGANGQDGALQRCSLQYDLTDEVSFTGGLVIYESGDRYDFKDNDRLFLEARYGF
jgi:hypothetical protein